MPEQLKFEEIDAMAAVYAVSATLRRIDVRLMDHGERVAYIACELCEAGKLDLDMKTLFLLCIFHDIGAYKTEEIDRMVEFETNDVQNHAIYGYLFLKYMTPLKAHAGALLYHHSPWSVLESKDPVFRDYAAMIHLADRMDIAMKLDPNGPQMESMMSNSEGIFKEEYAELMRRFIGDRKLRETLLDGSYSGKNMERCKAFKPSAAESLEYLKMIVYSIDFRSEHTVTHTVNTVSLALNIARHFGLSEEELEKIYLGSLLHDVGKIAIPESILEFPGRLTDEQMTVMRTHVNETKELIEGIVPEDICLIATRHHEKLDGSGYPLGLTGEKLSFPQRIVAVADIVSALSSRRSYKEPFPKERTVSILESMSKAQLDPVICSYVNDKYDEIMKLTDPPRAKVIAQYQDIISEAEALAVTI